MQPSQYQLGLLEWERNGKQHGVCCAVAGAGKSSSLVLVAQEQQNQGISPDQVRIMVFGKDNSIDLKNKFLKLGRQWKESVTTLHATGWSLLKTHLSIKGRQVKLNDSKYRSIARSLGFIKSGSINGTLRQNAAIGKDSDFLKLCDLIRATNQVPNLLEQDVSATVVVDLATHYQIEGVKDPEIVAAALSLCLKEGLRQAEAKEFFDFVEQIWLPVYWQLHQESWFVPYKRVLVDEAQDLNPVQLELAIALVGEEGRLLFVGDENQAIMGFAGADSESLQKIIERTNAEILPLSICYRCPSAHIELVRHVYPHIPIEARENAPEGWLEVICEKELKEHLQPGDLILSRRTASLVSLAISLISKGIPAVINGRDKDGIGKQLKAELDEIADLPNFDFKKFNEFVEKYRKLKTEKYHDDPNEEFLVESLNDRLEAITEIYKSQTKAQCIENLSNYIDSLFQDQNKPNQIMLSTCHRSKGLEAERVVIYDAESMPLSWKNQLDWQWGQENNLLYVALTRSKDSLLVVIDDKLKKDEMPLWISAAFNKTYKGSLKKVEVVETEAIAEPEQVEPEQAEPEQVEVVPSYIAYLSHRSSYYKAPELLKLEVDSLTATQVRVIGHRNIMKHKAYRLPTEDAWQELQALNQELQTGLNAFADQLRILGHYPNVLAEAQKANEKAPNPLASSIVRAVNPDSDSDNSSQFSLPWDEPFFLHLRRSQAIKHTKQMVRYYDPEEEIETVSKQEGFFLCPTDADWQTLLSIRDAVITDTQALKAYLDKLGTLALHKSAVETVEPVLEPDEELNDEDDEESGSVELPIDQYIWLNPGLIRLDLGTQSRFEGTNQAKVEQYAQEMKDGLWDWERDVPTVYFDGENYFPAGEGNHRIEAASIAGFDIYVKLQEGTLTRAKLKSAAANKHHGLPRTNADKRNQVEIILRDPAVLAELAAELGQPGTTPSNRTIADYCGVSAPFVGKIEKELTEAGAINLPLERSDRRGRTIKTGNIGREADVDEVNETDEVEGDETPKPKLSKVQKLCSRMGAKTVVFEALSECQKGDLREVYEYLSGVLESKE